MHDLGFRAASMFLAGGALLCVAFLFYSLLYPRKASADSGVRGAPAVAARPHDYGWLSPVARPLEWTLREVNGKVMYRTGRSSWGWTIVATTFVLNLLLLPFRILAARNAKVMQVLQPQIAAINAKYKGRSGQMDQEHSREISELYRKHDTHPLSGCVPMLAPWIVLMAFYSVLNAFAELHGAPWLWVADLSRPEQLPVRVLPVLMIVTQLALAKMAPNPSQDARANNLMAVMPVMLGFLFYRQPAALLLYMVTGNLLAIVQQWWLAKHNV